MKHYKLVGNKIVIPIKNEMFDNIHRVGRFVVVMYVEQTKFNVKLNIIELESEKEISVCCPLCDELVKELWLYPFEITPDHNDVPLCRDCFEIRVLPAK